MNVSLKWLGTLVDIKGLDPEEMAETLTVDGIPVERVISVSYTHLTLPTT